jgi:hypothetical protein
MQPDRELDYWPEFDTEIFFLIYRGDTICLVRADKPETAQRIYFKYKGINSHGNTEGYPGNYTEIRPRSVLQLLSDEQLKQIHRDSIVCWDVSS